ncbi:hypothetical protein M413DRAFT_442483 [Hebeloma cylindrosporum]|uniref:Uncharacterized protein n=1 Tax=Hebeloma cylindrosporum TaxID=76867 RepID=A0A0C3CL55_HEBCY|nr:hypothetical protein M413DRAFT_442483 [Hebeloma cylindrosporum h7]
MILVYLFGDILDITSHYHTEFSEYSPAQSKFQSVHRVQTLHSESSPHSSSSNTYFRTPALHLGAPSTIYH